jgi:hypothetical protein
MIKRLKHATTATMESLKKSKGPTCLNPDFEIAEAHLDKLKDRITVFIDDCRRISSALTPCFKSISDFTVLTQAAFNTLPEEDRKPAETLSPFVQQIPEFVQNSISKAADDDVIKPLRLIFHSFDELYQLKKSQHESFLILESNQTKLESLQKEPAKNGLEIEKYKEKITSRKQETENLETEFIERTRALWEHRYDVILPPLSSMLDKVTEIGSVVNQETRPLVESLDPALISTDFPKIEPQHPLK